MTPDTTARAVFWRRIGLAVVAASVLAGCATGPNPKDPFEKYNRGVFAFNDVVDRVALKPAATAYKEVLPTFVQTGISNFFGNMSDLWSSVNNLLQGKGRDGMSDFMRFSLNSTFGIAGLLDIASEAGLHKHSEDFGQTLGAWGVAPGPYVMLPLLGPSTFRDTVVLPIDIYADPWAYVYPVNVRNIGIAVRAIDQRAAVLDASNLMEEAALDRYEFIRDGFLQRRESRITDNGETPIRRIPLPFHKPAKKEGEPQGAKGIKDAYPDDPGATPPATPTAPPKDADLPADAKTIRSAYPDDPGPTPEPAVEQKPPVSTEPVKK
jgi:phospholipid-binding lipoprotein MlaA